MSEIKAKERQQTAHNIWKHPSTVGRKTTAALLGTLTCEQSTTAAIAGMCTDSNLTTNDLLNCVELDDNGFGLNQVCKFLTHQGIPTFADFKI